MRAAYRLALKAALCFGLLFCAFTALFRQDIAGWFIDARCPAYAIAVDGLPLFAVGFIFFAVNIVSIVYFQSVERAAAATWVTVMRGFVLMAACFLFLPGVMGVPGIWLAVPLAESLTAFLVCAVYFRRKRKQ